MQHQTILEKVAGYYSKKIKDNGPMYLGVDWNSAESQELRFQQLIKIVPDPDTPFSLLDYGCGYGALADYLETIFPACHYSGYDISEEMIYHAQKRKKNDSITYRTGLEKDATFDYLVASGIFNVRMGYPEAEWKSYMYNTLDKFNRLATKGFAFNLLTNYADTDKMTGKLYYASPEEMFTYCKKRYSDKVSLLHDYPLYEFTMLVRK